MIFILEFILKIDGPEIDKKDEKRLVLPFFQYAFSPEIHQLRHHRCCHRQKLFGQKIKKAQNLSPGHFVKSLASGSFNLLFLRCKTTALG